MFEQNLRTLQETVGSKMLKSFYIENSYRIGEAALLFVPEKALEELAFCRQGEC